MSATVSITAGGGIGALGAAIYGCVHWYRKRKRARRARADASQTKQHNEKEE